MSRLFLLIASGNASAAIFGLVRNLLVASLLPVSEYGAAATLAIVVSISEITGAFGVQQQIVQSKSGDDVRFQSNLHGFQILRGFISAALMIAISDPLAHFFERPDLSIAYKIMAAVPLLNALTHLDVHRMTRAHKFSPLFYSASLPAGVSLASVLPLSLYFSDYKIMMFSLLIQVTVTVLTSHALAERPYRISFNMIAFAECVSFGWPLLVNSALMFAIFQGDKVIVARTLGLESLGVLAMGITLTLTPTLVLAKTAQNLMLPNLSKAQTDSRNYSSAISACLQLTSLLAGTYCLVGAIFIEHVASVLLSAEFDTIYQLLTWLLLASCIRLFKTGPSIAALSFADTKNGMYSNIPRLALLPAIWYSAVEYGLVGVVQLALVAEVIGLTVSFVLLYRRSPVGISSKQIFPITFSFSVIFGVYFWAQFLRTDFSSASSLPVIFAMVLLCTLCLAWLKSKLAVAWLLSRLPT